MECKKKKLRRINAQQCVLEYVLRTGCAVIVLTFVAIIALLGYAAYDAWLKPPSPMWSGSYNSYDADTISTRDSVVKEVPKQEMKMVSPASSSSSKRSSYNPMIICSGLTRHRRMIWTTTGCRDIWMPMTMRIGNENHPRALTLSDDSFLAGEEMLA